MQQLLLAAPTSVPTRLCLSGNDKSLRCASDLAVKDLNNRKERGRRAYKALVCGKCFCRETCPARIGLAASRLRTKFRRFDAEFRKIWQHQTIGGHYHPAVPGGQGCGFALQDSANISTIWRWRFENPCRIMQINTSGAWFSKPTWTLLTVIQTRTTISNYNYRRIRKVAEKNKKWTNMCVFF